MKENTASKSITKRFFLRHSNIPPEKEVGDQYVLDEREEEIIYQLIKVFRVNVGQKIILINNNFGSSENTEYLLETKEVSKKSVILEITEKNTIKTPLKHPIILGLCLPNKPAKLEFILEKATELGVSEFLLIKSDLSQFPHQIRLDRLEKIVTEAAEQSEQIAIPKVAIIQNIQEYLAKAPQNGVIALERSEQRMPLLQKEFNEKTSILIGPEGGFSDKEVNLIKNSSHTKIKIGDSILKMDTAALLSVGIIALKLQG